MESDRARPGDTLAVLLILLGAATWMALPVTLVMIDDKGFTGHGLRIAALLFGCGLGGITAASALPRAGAAVIGGAAALATAALFAVPWLTTGHATRFAATDGWIVAAASAIAVAASFLGRLIPAARTRVVAAGAIQLAVLAAGAVVIAVCGRLDLESIVGIALLTLALALLAGGACSARLVPEVTGIEAALAWVVVAVSGLAVQLLSPPMVRFMPLFAIAAMVTVPFAAGLAASGAAMVRPAERDDLPGARAIR